MKRNLVAGLRVSFSRFFSTGATASQQACRSSESAAGGAVSPSRASGPSPTLVAAQGPSRASRAFRSLPAAQGPSHSRTLTSSLASKGLKALFVPFVFAVFFLVPNVLALANTLPDGRQYELVTPALKDGAIIGGALGGGSFWPPPHR